MTTLSLSAAEPSKAKVDALVVGFTRRPRGGRGPALRAVAPGLEVAFDGRLVAALADLGFTGGAEEVTRLSTFGATTASMLVAVGLGDPAKLTAETLRRGAGAGVRAATGARRVGLAVLPADGVIEAGEAVRAACEGALLGSYSFSKYRDSDGRKRPAATVVVCTPDARSRPVVETAKRAEILAAAVALARDLVNEPAGCLHPADLAAAAVAACTDAGCTVEVLDETDLARGGFGGILGVGQGSAHPPRLVRIDYRHPQASRTVALAGKGITFDSGGLSLKQSESMEYMKCDMGGAAAVVAALSAIGRLQPAVNVTGWVPTAENMPSGTAIRPGDVLTMYGGKRVEVINTDAEGRLILADTLARAAEEQPDVIVDAATLTGAQSVALGARTAAVMANDDDLRAAVCDAADRAGEAAWPMPLPPDLRKSLDSDIGDLRNTGERRGGMLVAGLFLKEFVGDDIPWAHVDIAGPAYNREAPWGYTPKGGTGAAVRTFVQFVEDQAAG